MNYIGDRALPICPICDRHRNGEANGCFHSMQEIKAAVEYWEEQVYRQRLVKALERIADLLGER